MSREITMYAAFDSAREVADFIDVLPSNYSFDYTEEGGRKLLSDGNKLFKVSIQIEEVAQ